jgi:vesicular inhibitory amino acid transporter
MQTMEEVTMNLDNSGIAADLATALIIISPFTKFALTLDPVARGVEQVGAATMPCYVMF